MPHLRRIPTSTIVSFLLICLLGADWPHWRGAKRNGVVDEVSGWEGESWQLRQLWEFQSGEGSSSPLVIGARVYLTGWSDQRDSLICLDRDTGKELWRQSYKAPRYGRHAVGDQGFYSGACSTPKYDDDLQRIFTLGIDGELRAWDAQSNGRLIWRKNLYDEYGAERRPEVAVRKRTRRDYGYTTSPLVLGDQVIVEVGSKQGNLVAFDKATGAQRWTSQNRDEAGHTGGLVPMIVEGVPCVAVLTLRNLVVTRVDRGREGQTVASYPWTTDFANNIPTPAVSGNSVIITTSYNHSAMCHLKISLEGAAKVWENKLQSAVCSPVIFDSKIYWSWRGVHCVDLESGKEEWSGGKFATPGSCLVTNDDRLIVYGNKGELALIETAKRSPNKFTPLASQRVFNRTDAWPHVVLAHRRLICRDRSGAVRCFSLGGLSR